jgi:hypothetical protein
VESEAETVREPFTAMVAPGTGFPLSSDILPEIDFVCARESCVDSTHSTKREIFPSNRLVMAKSVLG